MSPKSEHLLKDRETHKHIDRKIERLRDREAKQYFRETNGRLEKERHHLEERKVSSGKRDQFLEETAQEYAEWRGK